MRISRLSQRDWILFAVFVVLGLTNILAHELYRDEFQAFMLAQESVSIPDLLERMKFEGHPPLWHLLLYGLTRFSGNPFHMQLLHLVIACASAFMILLLPLPRWQRGYLMFGYFPLFEFLTVSRNYALGFMLCNALTLLIAVERKRYLLISVLLFLLCLTSFYGVLMAGIVGLYLIMDLRGKAPGYIREAGPGILLSGAGIVLVGVLLAFSFISPPQTGYIELPVGRYMGLELSRVFDVVRCIWKSYVTNPLLIMEFWNSNLLEIRPIQVVLSLVLVALSMAYFYPKPRVFNFYGLGTLAILLFSYFVYVGWLRHFGHLYVIFTMCLVLNAQESIPAVRTGWLSPKAGQVFIAFILTLQVFAGLFSSCLSWIYPFTAGKAVAQYIREQKLEDHVIVGDRDWALTTVAGHLGRPLYHLASHRWGTYVIWNNERNPLLKSAQLIADVNRLAREHHKDVLVVLNYELLKPGNLVKLKEFTRSVNLDENYYLYRCPAEKGRAG